MIRRVTKKFYYILSEREIIVTILLFGLMVIGGIFEMVSVSLMLPFMETVINPEEIMQNSVVSKFCAYFGITSSKTFLIFLGISLACAYIIKNAFLIFETYLKVKFVYTCMFHVQKRLYRNYLSKDYEFFLHVNSGEILRIINNDTKEAFLLLETLLTFFTEFVVIIMLLVNVFVISPLFTLAVAALILTTLVLIQLFIRPFIQESGKQNQDAAAKMSGWVLQGIQGIKEIKVMHRENYFQKTFEKSGSHYVNSIRKYVVWVQLPRFLIEAISMSACFLAIIIFIMNGVNIEMIIPIVSAIAMAAIRLLPAISRISTQLTDIAYREPMLNKMADSLDQVSLVSKQECSILSTHVNSNKTMLKSVGFCNKIQLVKVSFKYGQSSENVLKNVSITIPKGTSIGIIGPSGAGKTTLVDIILGLLTPQSGGVYIDGKSIVGNAQEWASQIGYIPQSIFILDSSVKENIAFGIKRDEINEKLVWQALKAASLDAYINQLPEKLDTILGERGLRMSGGQRQRIGIARALYYNPSILVFDEATSSLDNETEASVMEEIEQLKGEKTIIIIAHRLSTIRNCDTVYQVEGGKVIKV